MPHVSVAVYPALARALADSDPEPQIRDAPVLARWVMAHKARIAMREARGEPISATARALSDVADVSVNEALRRAALQLYPWVLDEHSNVRGLVLLGMGKLSGRELNPSSDVDLVALFDAEALAKLGAEAPALVASKLTEHTIRQLEAQTEYGQAWRVDMRLRPEGARGPLAHDVNVACKYFELFGRTWERAAYMRSRAVAGDMDVGATFEEQLRPWIWRKEVDPRVGQDLARMVLQSRLEMKIDVDLDLKLGHGGIREVEFFVQGLQLIWGGRHPDLRATNTLEALAALHAGGWVQSAERTQLEAAWSMFRRLEHDTQFSTMRQLHTVPPKERWDAIADAVGSHSAGALREEVQHLRCNVHTLFLGMLPGIADSPARALDGVRRLIRDGNTAALTDALSRLGYASPDRFSDALTTLARRPTDPFGLTIAQSHPGFAENLFDEILQCADPALASHGLARALRTWRDPTWLTHLLASTSDGRRALLAALGLSESLADLISARPERVVSLLRATPLKLVSMRSAEAESASLSEEEFVSAERRRKTHCMIELGAAQARHSPELARVNDATSVLSHSADISVRRSFERAQHLGGMSSWAVFAVGKLAGLELGYASDLDLVCVYRGEPEQAACYTSQVRHMIRLLSAHDVEGRGYQVDMRMRPSGDQGPLVASLEHLSAYYTHSSLGDRAALWQVQALLRTRALAGDSELIASCLQVFDKALRHAKGSDQNALRTLRETRLRGAAEQHASELSRGALDLKQGRGGLVDYEHGVQRMQLQAGTRGCSFADAVRSLRQSGQMDELSCNTLQSNYDLLRRVEQALALVTGRSDTLLSPGHATATRVRRWCLEAGIAEAREEELFFGLLRTQMDQCAPLLWQG